MKDWSAPSEIILDAEIFAKLLLVLLGVITWEVLSQLSFDWSIISRKRELKWPMFFYFWCKYSIFFGIIGVNIALQITTRVNCQALYTFNQFAGNTAIGTASTLLMFRTIAIWTKRIEVLVPLVALSLGQWGILFHGIATVRSLWVEAGGVGQCVVTGTQEVFIDLIYIYTMSFDLVVLVLSTLGLLLSPGRSGLWELLFKQGIGYFMIAFTANLIPAVFLLLNLNPAMNIMFTIPAAVASTIVATRSFVALSQFTNKDVYIHSTSQHASTKPNTKNSRFPPQSKMTGAGVHISMDTYARHEPATISTTSLDLERGSNPDSYGTDKKIIRGDGSFGPEV